MFNVFKSEQQICFSAISTKPATGGVLCKKRCSWKFRKIHRKYLCQSLFFNKVPGLWQRCFAVNFTNLLRTALLIEHLRWLLLCLAFNLYLEIIRRDNRKKHFDTLDEAIEDIKGGEYSGPQDVVLLLPANDPYASDEEEGDDDIGLAGNINLPSDVTGAVEIHRDNEESDEDESSNDGNGQSKWKRNKRKSRDGVQLLMLIGIKTMKSVML